MLEDSSCSLYRSFLTTGGSACDWMVRSVCRLMWFRGCPKDNVLGQLLCLSYTSELLHIVGNHMVVYANDITIYAVISR